MIWIRSLCSKRILSKKWYKTQLKLEGINFKRGRKWLMSWRELIKWRRISRLRLSLKSKKGFWRWVSLGGKVKTLLVLKGKGLLPLGNPSNLWTFKTKIQIKMRINAHRQLLNNFQMSLNRKKLKLLARSNSDNKLFKWCSWKMKRRKLSYYWNRSSS